MNPITMQMISKAEQEEIKRAGERRRVYDSMQTNPTGFSVKTLAFGLVVVLLLIGLMVVL